MQDAVNNLDLEQKKLFDLECRIATSSEDLQRQQEELVDAHAQLTSCNKTLYNLSTLAELKECREESLGKLSEECKTLKAALDLESLR